MIATQIHRNRRLIGLGLTMMSFSSGCVDILSYRFLGQVFTSAMTGNLALMGLSIGQANAAGAARNVTAFAGFLVGLVVGALVLRGTTRWRLVAAALIEAVLLGGFAAFWQLRGAEAALYGLIALSAIAMGIQSAIAHRIGMPGVTTTYFTGTTTGIVFGLVGSPTQKDADPPLRRTAPLRRIAWPMLALLAYVGGAVTSGWYTAGRSAPELSLLLPALPCAAALALAALIAIGRR